MPASLQHSELMAAALHRTLSDLTRAAVGLRQPDRGCTRKGPLKGLVLRSQLLVLLAEQVPPADADKAPLT